MKTTPILAALAIALSASAAMADPASSPTRAQVKAEAAQAQATGQLDAVNSYEVTAPVDHKQSRYNPSGLTREQVKAETRAYLKAHPNRAVEEYEPFAN
jgi:hypothetical protein